MVVVVTTTVFIIGIIIRNIVAIVMIIIVIAAVVVVVVVIVIVFVVIVIINMIDASIGVTSTKNDAFTIKILLLQTVGTEISLAIRIGITLVIITAVTSIDATTPYSSDSIRIIWRCGTHNGITTMVHRCDAINIAHLLL